MNNIASIIEIPVADFTRAVTFYQSILEIQIEESEMEGMQLGVFPENGETISVILVKGEGYVPSMEGALVYLNAGNEMQVILDKIEPHGGKVLLPKTEISPEMGYFAMFTDTEGNKLGLHGLS